MKVTVAFKIAQIHEGYVEVEAESVAEAVTSIRERLGEDADDVLNDAYQYDTETFVGTVVESDD